MRDLGIDRVVLARDNAALHLAQEAARRGGGAGPGVHELQALLRLESPPVRVECGSAWHRPDCRLVAGEQAHPATAEELSELRPCRVCLPAA